jgi:hypothetical protein
MEIYVELKNGKSFMITRLTSLKKLCEDPDDAGHFAFYLAALTQNRMENIKPNEHKHIEDKEWEYHKKLVAEACAKIPDYLNNPADNTESELRDLLKKLEGVQGEVRTNSRGTPVRSIINWNVLIAEDAVRCILNRRDSAYREYITARDYAEKYDPRYGTGLIPESAECVKDVANFRSNHYFGENIGEWMKKC